MNNGWESQNSMWQYCEFLYPIVTLIILYWVQNLDSEVDYFLPCLKIQAHNFPNDFSDSAGNKF